MLPLLTVGFGDASSYIDTKMCKVFMFLRSLDITHKISYFGLIFSFNFFTFAYFFRFPFPAQCFEDRQTLQVECLFPSIKSRISFPGEKLLVILDGCRSKIVERTFNIKIISCQNMHIMTRSIMFF